MAWTNDPLTNEIKITRIHIQEIRDKLDFAQEIECPIYCSGLHSSQEEDHCPLHNVTYDQDVDVTNDVSNDNPRYITDDSALYQTENVTHCPSNCPTHYGTVRNDHDVIGCTAHFTYVLNCNCSAVNSPRGDWENWHHIEYHACPQHVGSHCPEDQHGGQDHACQSLS